MNIRKDTADEFLDYVKHQTAIVYPAVEAADRSEAYRVGRLAFECGMLRGIIKQLIDQRDGK